MSQDYLLDLLQFVFDIFLLRKKCNHNTFAYKDQVRAPWLGLRGNQLENPDRQTALQTTLLILHRLFLILRVFDMAKPIM